jgi:Domain of unknown function (DUF4249)
MKKLSLALIFSIAFIMSCIDPLDIIIDKEVNILIVEGAITTQPGPHYIRLSRSAKYGSIFDGFIRPVKRAKVIIRDSDGNNFQLSEWVDAAGIGNGTYSTPYGFLPAIGKSYTLLITASDGAEYISLPETIIKASEILKLSAEFRSIPRVNDAPQTGLDVYATFQDNPERQNFYMWKNTGTYQINTFPENYVRPALDGGLDIPDPKDCCRTCWVAERSADRSLQLLRDNNVNGNIVKDQAAFIEDDGNRFDDKYLVRIEQHTLSREAYQFFSLLKNQIGINGDIFDPPPATLRGNMINLTNPDENVIGYFRASDVSVDSMFLTQGMLLAPGTLNTINDDCRQFKGGTTVKPSYW